MVCPPLSLGGSGLPGPGGAAAEVAPSYLLMGPPLLRVVGVQHLQATHLAAAAVKVGTLILKVAVAHGGVGTKLGGVFQGPTSHRGSS